MEPDLVNNTFYTQSRVPTYLPYFKPDLYYCKAKCTSVLVIVY